MLGVSERHLWAFAFRLPQGSVWKAVQQAKRKGLSLRAIACELGISRVTVAMYARASRPPPNRFGMGEAGVNGALIENAAVPVN